MALRLQVHLVFLARTVCPALCQAVNKDSPTPCGGQGLRGERQGNGQGEAYAGDGNQALGQQEPLDKEALNLGLQQEEELTSLLFSCLRGPCCSQRSLCSVFRVWLLRGVCSAVQAPSSFRAQATSKSSPGPARLHIWYCPMSVISGAFLAISLFFLFRTPLPELGLCVCNFPFLGIHILFWNLSLCSWFKMEA